VGSRGTSLEGGADPVVASGALVVQALDRTWGWLSRRSSLVFTLLLVGYTVLRTGVSVDREDATMVGVWIFPEPIPDYRANSLIGPAVGHVAGVRTWPAWTYLNVGVLVAVVLVVSRCLVSAFASKERVRVAAIWVSLCAVAPSVLQKVTSYDPWTVMGTALVVLPRRRRLPCALVGGVVVALSNAEQGLLGLAAAALLLVALPQGDEGPPVRDRLLPLAWAAGAIVATRVVVLVWWTHLDAEVPSRFDVFHIYLGDSIRRSVGSGLAGVYSWYGVAWLVLGFAAVVAGATERMTPVRWLGVATALVVVPAAVTSTTLDGTRVFAMVSFPAFLVLLRWIDARSVSEPAQRTVQRLTTAALLVGLLLPALVADPRGEFWFRLPWASPPA
jgi:hypothetical protein